MDHVIIQQNVGIVAHGDADGICSAAILKSLYPGARIMFSTASKLHKVIREIEKSIVTLDILFIVDIAISQRSKKFVLERLKKSKQKYNIIYYDNHVLPPPLTPQKILNYVNKYVSKRGSSSSSIVFQDILGTEYKTLINFRFQALLGAYGAIADYARECKFLRNVLNLYDEANTYYQAFMLKQASRIIDDDNLKRIIVDKLSVGILPSEIAEVTEAAREASREVDVAVNFIKKYAMEINGLGVIIECPVASMGHNAYIAATMTNSRVGVAVRRKGGKAYFVLRKKRDDPINLGMIAMEVSANLGVDGGGEEATAGITADDTMISQILELIGVLVKNSEQ